MSTLVFLAPYSDRLWAGQLPHVGKSGDIRLVELKDGATIEDMAQAILPTLPDRFSIVAFCIGGHVALEMLRVASERVERLALISASAGIDSPQRANARSTRIAKLSSQISEDDYTIAGEYISNTLTWMLAGVSLENPKIVQQASDLLASLPKTSSVNQQKAMLTRPDRRSFLPSIRVPTMVIAGKSDRICPASESVEIGKAIRGSQTRLLKDCGHLAPIEQPELVSTHLLQWFSRNLVDG